MRNIFITGGTGLVGFELVKSLVLDGHHVFFTSRDKQKALELVQQERINVNQVSVVIADFGKADAIEQIIHQIPTTIDALIHNAREVSNLKMDDNGYVSADHFQGELFMALTFPYLLSNAIIQHVSALKDIVFISSMYGSVAPNPALYTDFDRQSPINYGVAKAGQIHLTKEMAVRLAVKGIRCNCISYGGIEGRVDEAFLKRYAALSPMKSMLSKNDLYPPLKFVLDNPQLKLTGENIKVDGGWTLW